MPFYNRCKKDIWARVHDWAGYTYKIALVRDTYTFNADHQTMTDITGAINYELNGGNGNTNGYYAGFSGTGRKTLANKTLVQDDANDRALLKCDAIVWPSLQAAAGSVGGYVVFLQPGGAASDADCLLCWYAPKAPAIAPNGNDFVIQPDTVNGFAQDV